MTAKMTVPYDDGTFRLKAGDEVPAEMPKHRLHKLLRSGLAKEVPARKAAAKKAAPKKAAAKKAAAVADKGSSTGSGQGKDAS